MKNNYFKPGKYLIKCVRIKQFKLNFQSFFISLGLLLFFSPVKTQEWEQLTAGLYVHAILPVGNDVWIGTDDGLIKMNKTDESKTFYNTANSPLKSNVINSLTLDNQGTLWIGTKNGLVKYHNNIWENIDVSLKTNTQENNILDIEINNMEEIWLSLGNGALVKVIDNSDQWEIYYYNGENTSGLADIEADGLGNIWGVLRGMGITKFNNGNWTLYEWAVDNNITKWLSLCNKLAVDNQNKIWIASEHEGLISFDGTIWKIYEENWGLTYDILGYMNDIKIDGVGNKWVATDKKGIFKFTPNNTVTFYEDPNATIILSSLTIDNEIVWLGTRNGASVMKFDGINFTSISTSSIEMQGDMIRKMIKDSNGNLWIATDKGLMKYNATDWEIFTKLNSLLTLNDITTITSDNQGNIWVVTNITEWGGSTTQASKIYKINVNGIWQEIITSSDIYYIADITVDNNVLWIVGSPMDLPYQSKVGKLENNIWTIYSGNGLPQDEFRCIAVNGQYCWVGTSSNGLARLNIAQETWNTYTTADGISGNVVNQIVIQGNNIWLATEGIWQGDPMGGGISKWNGTQWSLLNTNDELLDATVKTLWIEGDQIWAGVSGKGIFFFDGSMWNHFDTENGHLTSNWPTSIMSDANNHIYVGTLSNGLNVTTDEFLDLEKNINENKLNIYPNPTESSIFINSNYAKEDMNFEIFDLLGKKLFEGKISSSNEINLSEWKGQFLTLKIILPTQTITKKIIVK